MSKIIGVTVGTTLPKPNWKQNDPTKGDFIKNKPGVVTYTEQTLTDQQKAQARANIGITGTGKDGEDGYTPKKGVDYFTEADKSEMVSAVIDALPIYNGEAVRV